MRKGNKDGPAVISAAVHEFVLPSGSSIYVANRREAFGQRVVIVHLKPSPSLSPLQV